MAMARERSGHGRFLIASVILHVVVLGAGLIDWPWFGNIKTVPVTPVTILTSDQLAKLMAAEESFEPQQAQTEEPLPEAPPEATTPQPTPAAPEPVPAPKPAPTPKANPKAAPKSAEKAPAAKTQAKAAASRPAPGLDLDALAQSIQADRPSRTSGSARSSAAKGPSRQETDLQKRAAEGAARAAVVDFTSAVADQVGRVWRPNCGVAGAANLRIRVRLRLNADGSLIDAKLVDYPNDAAISDPVTRAAATRALSAVSDSAPFRGMPPASTYDQWKSFIVTFAGRDACG